MSVCLSVSFTESHFLSLIGFLLKWNEGTAGRPSATRDNGGRPPSQTLRQRCLSHATQDDGNKFLDILFQLDQAFFIAESEVRHGIPHDLDGTLPSVHDPNSPRAADSQQHSNAEENYRQQSRNSSRAVLGSRRSAAMTLLGVVHVQLGRLRASPPLRCTTQSACVGRLCVDSTSSSALPLARAFDLSLSRCLYWNS